MKTKQSFAFSQDLISLQSQKLLECKKLNLNLKLVFSEWLILFLNFKKKILVYQFEHLQKLLVRMEANHYKKLVDGLFILGVVSSKILNEIFCKSLFWHTYFLVFAPTWWKLTTVPPGPSAPLYFPNVQN